MKQVKTLVRNRNARTAPIGFGMLFPEFRKTDLVGLEIWAVFRKRLSHSGIGNRNRRYGFHFAFGLGNLCSRVPVIHAIVVARVRVGDARKVERREYFV